MVRVCWFWGPIRKKGGEMWMTGAVHMSLRQGDRSRVLYCACTRAHTPHTHSQDADTVYLETRI